MENAAKPNGVAEEFGKEEIPPPTNMPVGANREEVQQPPSAKSDGDSQFDPEDVDEDANQDGEDGEGEDQEFDEEDYDDEDDSDPDDEDSDGDDDIDDIPEEEKTPVTVVTGFLGAGKTTLVNYILKEQREMKIAVIENEYGAVSIDTALVEENVQEAEDIVTMDNGCVCCTVRGDLVKALVNFLPRRHTFDCILLETTGIADPSPIVSTFNQDSDVRINYRIDSVLCLVDAKNIVTQLGRTSAEEGAVNEAVQQLAFADSVIINKTDLVDEDQLALVKAKINSVNAFAKVVQSEKSRVPLDSVLNLRRYNLDRTLELLEEESKEDAARQQKLAEDAEEAKKADEGKHDHDKHGTCGEGCSHDHDHKHDHDAEGHDHKHSSECGEGCTSHEHGHGEKRKRGEGEDEAGDGNAAAAAQKKPNEQKIRVTATRHDSKVGSLGLTLQGSLDVDKFNDFIAEFLREHSADLFRSKGVLAFKGLDQKFVFQGVHEQINCEPSNAEWDKDGSNRESKIVFIGLELDKNDIAEKLKACLVD